MMPSLSNMIARSVLAGGPYDADAPEPLPAPLRPPSMSWVEYLDTIARPRYNPNDPMLTKPDIAGTADTMRPGKYNLVPRKEREAAYYTPRDEPKFAIASYQQGTDNVPETGPAIVHKGEMIIPKDEADKIRNGTLSHDEMVKRWVARGYPKAAAEGIADNMMRESGGKSSIMGDQGTSGGLFQHHADRLTELKAYAKDKGKDWTDPNIQIDFADKELKDKFPELRKTLLASSDRGASEQQFKRIFERPASVLWSTDASGGPVLGTRRYRFSDYALEDGGRGRNRSMVYMDPADYLALSPSLEGDPTVSRSGRSLRASLDRGDAIEAVPSLDMRVSGPTGTITGQDGRHRALLAQEEGVDQIPVSISQRGEGSPSEIVGMTGRVLPNDFQAAKDVTRQPWEGLVRGALASATPTAEQAPFWQAGGEPVSGDTAGGDWWKQGGEAVSPESTPAQPPRSIAERVGTGMLDPVMGIGQAAWEGIGGAMSLLPGAAGRKGQEIEDWAMRKAQAREAQIQAERKAGGETGTDWWRLGGNVAATLPLGALGTVGRATTLGRLAGGALAGGAGAAAQPVVEGTTPGDFWRDKATQTAVGAATGGVLGALGEGLSHALGPAVSATARKLMGEGIDLTPGMLAGGALRRAEDAMASIPILGTAIRSAQRRALEQFNRAAINRGLADIGVELPRGVNSGHDAISFAQDEFAKAYDAVLPRMRGVEDPTYRAEMTNVVFNAARRNLPPDQLDQLHRTIGEEIIARFNMGRGTVTGREAQTINSQLRMEAERLARSTNRYDQERGRYLQQARDVFNRMMERNNPALQAAKQKIDNGYAQFKIAETAAMAGRSIDSPVGTFTPSQLDLAVRQAARRAGRSRAYARGAARMQDLSAAARDVLPARVPDSGTPERAVTMGILGGGLLVEPTMAGIGAGMALPYTRMGGAALRRMTSPATSNMLRTIGQYGAPAAGAVAGNAAGGEQAPPQ